MNYLVGTFERFDTEFFENDDPLMGTRLVDKIDKSHLVKAKQDTNYQVIDLQTMQFYNPKTNNWEPIRKAVLVPG